MSSQRSEGECSIPVICGRVSAALLSDYLGKKTNFRQFAAQCRKAAKLEPVEVKDGGLVGFVSQQDLDHEDFKKGGLYEGTVGRSVYFAFLPLSTELIPCLKWARSWPRKEEGGRPDLVPVGSLKTTHGFAVSEPWIEVLCRLQARVMQPLLQCLKFASPERAVGIKDEISKRRSAFGKFGDAFFFQDAESTLAWDIAANWQQWENEKASADQRRDHVCKRWGIPMTVDEFMRFTPIRILPRLKDPRLSIEPSPLLEKMKSRVIELLDSRPIRKQYTGNCTKAGELIYCEPPPLPFSRGGYFEEPFFRQGWHKICRIPAKGGGTTEAVLENDLWWWNRLKLWPEQWTDEFPDNWERSAFLYELRARLLPGYTWDLFEGPWSQLDVSQRAVLYYLWPPEGQGKHWRNGRINSDTPAEHDFRQTPLTIDPAATLAAQVKALENEHRYWRHELLGIDDVSKRKRPLKRKDWKWTLLENLDRTHFFRDTLTDIKARQRAIALHEKACREAGLPPDKPVW